MKGLPRSNKVTAKKPQKLPIYAKTALPPSPEDGLTAFVSNDATDGFCMIYSQGGAWKKVKTQTAVA